MVDSQSSETVFISYSHDSPEHAKRVLELANKLRSEGIDCVLDQYEESPPEGWPRWMDREIKKAGFVIMICTKPYYLRVMGEEKEEVGHGVKWEGNLICQHIYNSGSQNSKFIPVLMDVADKKYIPTPLQGSTNYAIADQQEYDRLYFRLTRQTYTEKPALGKRHSLPKKEVKTNVAMFLSSPIDIETWNKAEWSATFFAWAEGMPPMLGLGFKNEAAAKKIFRDWHERYGTNDEYEELYISIIEGEIDGKPGYSVHIGPDVENLSKRYKKYGFKEDDIMMCVSRINRMNPSLNSTNLEKFKEAYRKHKTYLLIPGVLTGHANVGTPFVELGILKNKIAFRTVDEIGENDVDNVIFSKEEC